MAGNKRGPNFTPEDASLLLNLVERFQHLIENKSNSTSSIQQKKEGWELITKYFNASSSSSVPRTVAALKEKFYNMKKRSKLKLADEKTSIKDSGGGRKVSNSSAEPDAETIGNQATGSNSQFDGDSASNNETSKNLWETVVVSTSPYPLSESPSATEMERDSAVKLRPRSCMTPNEVRRPSPCPSDDEGMIISVDGCSTRPPIGVIEPTRVGLSVQGLREPHSTLLRTERSLGRRSLESSLTRRLNQKVVASGEELSTTKKHAEELHQQQIRFNQEKHELKLQFMKKKNELKLDILRLEVLQKRRELEQLEDLHTAKLPKVASEI